MKLLEEYKLKGLSIKNRIVMPPMCMYKAAGDGFATEFHLNHYTTRAVGGVGLIIIESTAVNPEGRITDYDLGLWDDSHISGLKKIVDSCHAYGAKIAVQINHAGRKSTASTKGIYAPSAIPFNNESRVPNELTREQIKIIVSEFKAAAARADEAGFDAIEVHAAHGYLIHQFLSPLSNKRSDEYGGDIKNRSKILQEVLEAVKSVWPQEKPISVRVSALDHCDQGIDAEQMVAIINQVKKSVDIVHVSSGGLLPAKVKDYPGYMVPLAEKIKRECAVPTITVGLITQPDMVEEILQNQRADMVALGRELLRNPYWVLNIAAKSRADGVLPDSYKAAF